MPAVDQSKFYVTFVGGLNTEATKLTFPENSATDLDNVDIRRNGEVRRRLGVDFEDGYVLSTAEFPEAVIETDAISTNEWKAVNGKGELNFCVLQVGSTLYFHNLSAEPISDSLVGSVSLAPYQVGSTPLSQSIVDVSYGEGRIIVCNAGMNPVYITYDEDLNTFTPTVIQLRYRDFTGLDDGYGVSERPADINGKHWYNLRNQGWPVSTAVAQSKSGSQGFITTDPVLSTKLKMGFYPSNSDIIYQSKIPVVEAGKEEVLGSYSPYHLENAYYGNTPAPKGHFILDVFNRDYRGAIESEDDTPPVETASLTDAQVVITERPTCTAFYAGRVWYSGIANKNVAGNLYFSQILIDIDRVGNCYQEQDPTAEDLNSLLATDGGVIHISDMGKVLRMEQIGQDLTIVASNGIWAVSGTEGANFKADDFTVRKIADVNIIGRDNIIVAESGLFFWDKGGIWQVATGQISNALEANRISRDTIQSFYEDIADSARAYAKGFYDDFDKKIYWFYNDTDAYDAIDFRFRYNRALVLDLTLSAFYTYTIADLDSNSPFVAGITQKEPGNETVVTYNVVVGTDQVMETADTVVQDIAFEVFSDSKLKLLTFVEDTADTYKYTFSEFESRDFVDWLTWDQEKNNISNTGAN